MERPNALENYRNLLIQLEQKSYEDYDKALLAMSGGALAISLAFVKNIGGNDPVQLRILLIMSWILWTLTILAVLWSFVMSQRALREAVEQIDAGENEVTLGGFSDKMTGILNIAGGFFLFVGCYSYGHFCIL